MLANRLIVIVPKVVTQSAFFPGRLITDNILVAYECFHVIKKKTHGSNGYCVVKLDMNRAYDHVEWSFLEKNMQRMGFHDQWVRLIMELWSVSPLLAIRSILTSRKPRRFCVPEA